MKKYKDLNEFMPRSGRAQGERGNVINEVDVVCPSDPSHVNPNFAFYLTDTGAVGGVLNAIGDYSLEAKEFSIKPAAGEILKCNRMIITIEDNGSIDSGGYGNNASPLTNGITVESRIAGEPVRLLTAQEPIKRTADWNSLCYDGAPVNFGAGNEFYVARWTFTRDGKPIILREGDEIVVILNDNFGPGGQAILGHKFLIKGEIVEE